MNTTMGLSLSVEDGVAIIVYDQVNSPINTLNSRIIPEFEQLFDRITADTKITSAVLMSGKRDTWIAGADIEELASLHAPLHSSAMLQFVERESLRVVSDCLFARMRSRRARNCSKTTRWVVRSSSGRRVNRS